MPSGTPQPPRTAPAGPAEAPDGEAAVDLVAKAHPQVVLMDLNMPGADGVTATARITAEHPGTRVVVLTTYRIFAKTGPRDRAQAIRYACTRGYAEP